MFSVFENPWILFTVSAILVVIIAIIRQISPEKCHSKLLLVPVFLGATAFGLDLFFKTDYEKIEITIKRGIEAAVAQDIEVLGSTISDDYSGVMYHSKEVLLNACQIYLSMIQLEKVRIRQNIITISSAKGTSQLRLVLFMQPQSDFAPGKSLLFLKLELYFEKTANKEWLIAGSKLITINDDPIN